MLRIRDVYPGFRILISNHPGSQIQIQILQFFVATNIIKFYFFIKLGLGLGIRDPEKTYSGPRIQGQKGTGSRIRNTGF